MFSRGKCTTVLLNNGRAVSCVLKHLYNWVKHSDEAMENYLTSEISRWIFIPTIASNFGGLWEAAIIYFTFPFKVALGYLRLAYKESLNIKADVEGIR